MESENNKWEIHLETIHCPQCNEKMPPFRIPENIQQIMWGGWVCPKCGCKMDKFGSSTE